MSGSQPAASVRLPPSATTRLRYRTNRLKPKNKGRHPAAFVLMASMDRSEDRPHAAVHLVFELLVSFRRVFE